MVFFSFMIVCYIFRTQMKKWPCHQIFLFKFSVNINSHLHFRYQWNIFFEGFKFYGLTDLQKNFQHLSKIHKNCLRWLFISWLGTGT
jgi:hypothetical protein